MSGNLTFVIVVVTVWVILSILGGIGEGVYLGQHESGSDTTTVELGVIYNLTHPSGLSWFTTLISALAFDFSFFSGGWAIFQWIFFAPLTIALALGIFATVGGWGVVALLGIFGLSGIVSILS
jgi:hypothetical protein